MRYLVALAALTGLGACSSLPQMPAMPKFALPHLPGAAPDSEKSTDEAVVLAPLPKTASVRERVSRAVELLNEGRREEARAGISEALAMSPKDATALRLLDQIDKDPAVLLGDKNETYVVAAGDTMSGLAARFTGDPLMFYALARYNGLTSPKALSVGQTLKIPSRSGTVVANTLPAQPEAPAARALPVNASKANTVRLEALEKLNAGDVSRAVTLLTEAQALDETNVAIAKDLERARRIQSALVNS